MKCSQIDRVLIPLFRVPRLMHPDGICSVETERAETASRFVQESLANADFVAHPTKSHWSPSYQVTWLGFNIDLQLGQIIVPTGKVQAFQSLVAAAIKAVMLPACHIARIIGKIISLSLAMGPISRLMTRSLYAVVNPGVISYQ